MEEVKDYRNIICTLIREYAQITSSTGDIQKEIVFDEENDHHELMYSGWNGSYRIHSSVLHIDIRDGKVWIQYDGTPDGVAEEFVKAGIPREHIVLAFKHPNMRPYTDYAVA